MNFNRVVIAGHLTRDVEVRRSKNDNPIGNTGIAVNRKWKEDEYVSFFEVTIFGKQAETLFEYAGKGSPILFEGRLRQDRWENDNGEKRNKVKIIAESFRFAGSPREKKESDSEGNSDSDDPGAVPF